MTKMLDAEAVALIRADMEVADETMPIQVRTFDASGKPVWYLCSATGRVRVLKEGPRRSVPTYPPEASN